MAVLTLYVLAVSEKVTSQFHIYIYMGLRGRVYLFLPANPGLSALNY